MNIYFELVPKNNSDYLVQLQNCLIELVEKLNLNKLNKKSIVKLSIFLYVDNLEQMDEIVLKSNQLLVQYFNGLIPPVAFIAQAPCSSLLAMEVIALNDEFEKYNIELKKLGNFPYIKLIYQDKEEIYCAGICNNKHNLNISNQSHRCFRVMEEILKAENFELSDIVRQWNYIEDIYKLKNIKNKLEQNYQIFNEIRAEYYNKYSWKNCYPAATGIGVKTGGIIIDFFAVKYYEKSEIIPLSNPKQLDAHQYSESQLKGIANNQIIKATPKFERGKIIGYDNYLELYISGTASILGEETLHKNDPELQTTETIENILELISEQNLKKYGLNNLIKENKFEYLRVYIKNLTDYKKIMQICSFAFGEVPIIYLIADICREDLLVEIEGMVRIYFS